MDGIDTYIGKKLKNWAARQQTPANARTRLLQAAGNPVIHPAEDRPLIFPEKKSPTSRQFHKEWTSGQMEWKMSDSFKFGVISLQVLL